MTRPLVHAFLVAVALLAGGIGPARADYEETERRLKSVGIEGPLRADIHRAIDRAVGWFAEKQISDGSWLDPGTWAGHWGKRAGLTTISALALRHAGTPRARECAGKAMRFLFERREVPDEVVTFVYTAGLASMLLAVDGAYPRVHETIGKALATAVDMRTGWFGYYGRAVGYATAPPSTDFGNLSTTQFAALGLWAAARRGFSAPEALWRLHARGLVATQTKSGSWSYAPKSRLAGYSTGTFMGFANLLLCEQHLRTSPDPDLARRMLAAKTLALPALRRDAKALLESLAAGRDGAWSYSGERWSYYSLYALEKACIFAGIEDVGGVRWYEAGARGLLALQEKDGGWGIGSSRSNGVRHPARSDLLSTAFALLFLLRTSEVYRPVTPSSVDVPRAAPVTPR